MRSILTASTALTLIALSAPAHAQMLDVEKDELTFGFIKLTDMAPLAVAYELGYFEDEGLFVTLEPQANWKVLLDGVIEGRLDGAHMLAGQPLAATIGYGTEAHIVTPFSMDLNGNAITVSNEIWAAMKPNIPHEDGKPVHPIGAEAMTPVVQSYRAEGRPFNMGMVFPVSTHNYELRYWLAAGGLNPGFYARMTRPVRSTPRCCCRSPRRRRCPPRSRRARSSAIASASHGTSRRCSKASACR